MPRAKLEFNLPEENDEFKLATHAVDLHRVINNTLNELREILKYGNKKFENPDEALEYIQKFIYEEFENGTKLLFDYFD